MEELVSELVSGLNMKVARGVFIGFVFRNVWNLVH
jgi:hypothetical protein